MIHDGSVLCAGSNETIVTRNVNFNIKLCALYANLFNTFLQPTRHAELVAFDKVLPENGDFPAQLADKFGNSTLYVTCEPCIMCAGAIRLLGLFV